MRLSFVNTINCLLIISSSHATPLQLLESRAATPIAGYSYSGCYTEATNGRALSGNALYDDRMTVEKCAAACKAYSLFGVEYGRECFCGNTINSGSVLADEGDCSFTCSGNKAQSCGGGNRLDLYQKSADEPSGTTTDTGATTSPVSTPTSSKFTAKGCYTEATSGRALAGKSYVDDSMTVEVCAATCEGFTYFGLEYYHECYCGYTLRSGSVPAETGDCNLPCSGDKTELCGGGNRLNLYEYSKTSTPTPAAPSSTPYVSEGCYTEATNSRALTGPSNFNDAMTVDFCANYCSEFLYFGVEYGRECFCGNSLQAGSALTAEGDCSFSCAGNSAEKCGAGNRLNLYRVGGAASPSSSATSSSSSLSTSAATSTTSVDVSSSVSAVSSSISAEASSSTSAEASSSTPAEPSSSTSAEASSSTSAEASSSTSAEASSSTSAEASTSTPAVTSTTPVDSSSSMSAISSSTPAGTTPIDTTSIDTTSSISADASTASSSLSSSTATASSTPDTTSSSTSASSTIATTFSASTSTVSTSSTTPSSSTSTVSTTSTFPSSMSTIPSTSPSSSSSMTTASSILDTSLSSTSTTLSTSTSSSIPPTNTCPAFQPAAIPCDGITKFTLQSCKNSELIRAYFGPDSRLRLSTSTSITPAVFVLKQELNGCRLSTASVKSPASPNAIAQKYSQGVGRDDYVYFLQRTPDVGNGLNPLLGCSVQRTGTLICTVQQDIVFRSCPVNNIDYVFLGPQLPQPGSKCSTIIFNAVKL